MIAHAPRHADATGLGDCLEARCDVDAIAEDAAILDHHIADIDPDAQQHTALGWQVCVGLGQRLLDGNGAMNSIDDACELSQYAVAGSAGDFAAINASMILR